MPKVNEYVLMKISSKKYSDGCGHWVDINNGTKYCQREVDCYKNHISGMKFLKVEEDGKLTIIQ